MMSHIRELYRRLRMTTAAGVTSGPIRIGPDGLPVVQVQLATLEYLDLRVVEQRGFASDLPIGTPVTAQFIGGDRSNGFVTGSTSPADRPATSGTDDRVIFAHGFTVRVLADGIHVTAPTIFLEGNVQVTGFVEATGEVTAKQGAASVSLSTHKGHGPGTNPPTPGT